MRIRYLPILVVASSLVAASPAEAAVAQAGLSPAASGVGLKHRDTPQAADLAFGGEAMQAWRSSRSSDYSLYGGAREAPRLGLRTDESYGGVVYSFGRRWGSSLEAGVAPESPLAPRRYSLAGQLHTALANGRGMSMGLKYRVYDGDGGDRAASAFDALLSSPYTLAPSRVPGASLAPSYQVQFSYQYSAAGSFGLALGRDVETYTPLAEPGLYGARQLSLTGQHWLTPAWALSYDVQSSEPTNPLRVQSLGLRLGVRYRF